MLAKETEGDYKQPWLQLHFHNQPSRFHRVAAFCFALCSRLLELASVFMRLDHVTSFIENADHRVM
jgi:hypothetical protein